jgi:signal transduction histidine kinase
VPQAAEIVMYRLVQECLTNVLKHANAGQVNLNISRKNGSLCLSVEDDGVGFDLPAAARKLDSFGLAGMRERVTMLGGLIDIRSAKGKGTRILATLPV